MNQMRYAISITEDAPDTEMTIFMEDGGVITTHHNGEHLLTEMYQDRADIFDGEVFDRLAEGKMYEHDAGTMSMTRFETNFLSVGSGSEYAYGSLYSTQVWSDGKKRVRIAIESATKYSPSCMQPIDVISIPRKETK